MSNPRIPDEPEGLTEADSTRWQFVAARLKALEADIVKLKRQVRREGGGKMPNRAGGFSTTPTWRALQRAEKAAEDCRSVLVRLLGKAKPVPEPELTLEQMQAEFKAVFALPPDRPEEVTDEVIALAHRAAADPPDAEAAEQLAAILARYEPALAAWRASIVLPDLDE